MTKIRVPLNSCGFWVLQFVLGHSVTSHYLVHPHDF